MAIPYCYKETHISCRNRKPFSSYFSWSHTLGHPSPFITGPIHAHTHTSVSAREFIFDKHLPMIKSRPSMAHSGGMCPTVLLCVIHPLWGFVCALCDGVFELWSVWPDCISEGANTLVCGPATKGRVCEAARLVVWLKVTFSHTSHLYRRCRTCLRPSGWQIWLVRELVSHTASRILCTSLYCYTLPIV